MPMLEWSFWTAQETGIGSTCPCVPPPARFIDVELRQVRLMLGDSQVLRRVDWHIRPGQRWVLTGPNGAGKTQLLKLLAGDVWPTPGRSVLRRYRWQVNPSTTPMASSKKSPIWAPSDRTDTSTTNGITGWSVSSPPDCIAPIFRSAPLSEADRTGVARLLSRLRISSARQASLPHPLLWRAAAGVAGARTGLAAEIAAAR